MIVPVGSWPEVHARPTGAFAPTLDSLGWGSGWERLPGGEDCAAFAAGDRVVKFLPPDAGAAVRREVALFERIRLPVPTPRLLDRHTTDGWSALLLTRVPGRPIGQVWSALSEAERERLLIAIGEVAAVMRLTQVHQEDPVIIDTRHGPEAEAWVHAHRRALGPNALLHGDLTDENVLVEGTRLSGVVDFGGVFVAPPLVDLVSPGVFLARGRRNRLRAILAGSGLDASPELLLAAHLLHPYSRLPRDLGFAGLPGDLPIERAVALWGG